MGSGQALTSEVLRTRGRLPEACSLPGAASAERRFRLWRPGMGGGVATASCLADSPALEADSVTPTVIKTVSLSSMSTLGLGKVHSQWGWQVWTQSVGLSRAARQDRGLAGGSRRVSSKELVRLGAGAAMVEPGSEWMLLSHSARGGLGAAGWGDLVMPSGDASHCGRKDEVLDPGPCNWTCTPAAAESHRIALCIGLNALLQGCICS